MWLGLVAVCVAAGCGGAVTSNVTAQFRVVSAATNPGVLDVFTDSDVLANGIGASGFTNYFNQNTSLMTIGVRQTGNNQTLASTGFFPVPGEKYTILPYQATSSNLGLTILGDSTGAPAAQKIKLRFIHVDRLEGAVDVYLVAPQSDLSLSTPILTSRSFESFSNYIELPAATTAKEIVITDAGTINQVGNSITFTPTAGMIRSFMFTENSGPKLYFYTD